MTARLVNGGDAVKPWIAGYIGDRAGVNQNWPKMDLQEGHLKLIKHGMDRVVNHEKGTAFGSRIKQEAWAMGGKTGTAQVKRITLQQRLDGVQNVDLPWRQRHHGLFVGYAPVQNPRYVCAVVVEHGVGGSSSAAPLARDLLIKTQARDPAGSAMKPYSVG